MEDIVMAIMRGPEAVMAIASEYNGLVTLPQTVENWRDNFRHH